MSETLDLTFVRDRLMRDAGVSASEAGEIMRRALAVGSLHATADLTVRPAASRQYHTDADVFLEAFTIPAAYWEACSVQWEDHRPYFVFFAAEQAYLTGTVTVLRKEARDLLRAHDLVHAAPHVPEDPVPKSRSGGRPAKHDWAEAAGFAAGFVAENDYPSTQAELERQIAAWFRSTKGSMPDESEIARFVRAMYGTRKRRG